MKSQSCCWHMITSILIALLMFTIGLLVGALYAPALLLYLPVLIFLSVLWFVLLIIVGVVYCIRCFCSC